MKTAMRGIFLTSEKPWITAQFYEQVATVPLERVGQEGQYVYWRFDADGMQLAIHDAQAFAGYAFPPFEQSNLTHIYFQIEDQQAFLAHLAGLGVSPWLIDDVVVTVIDPDGRKVLFGTA